MDRVFGYIDAHKDESIRIADFIDGIKHIAVIIHLFGGGR